MRFDAQILPALRRNHRFGDKGLRVRGKDMPRHPESPAFSTKSLITNSAMGLRQILPWQIKSTLVISKYFLLSYHFRFGKRMSKIQFCLKNSRSTSSGRGVWFGYFSRRGAAEPSMM